MLILMQEVMTSLAGKDVVSMYAGLRKLFLSIESPSLRDVRSKLKCQAAVHDELASSQIPLFCLSSGSSKVRSHTSAGRLRCVLPVFATAVHPCLAHLSSGLQCGKILGARSC